MSEMVERVARALCRSKRNRPEGYPESWMERHVNENWPQFAHDAKTVIEAMRMPTKGMIFDVAGDLTVWQAMIQEAQRC